MPKEYPRALRINAQLQREITELIRNELTDPRVEGVSVSEVEASPDMRHAKVRVSQINLREPPERAVAALNRAAGKLRFGLKQRLRMKHIPELHFFADTTAAQAEQMERLIKQARKEDREHASDRGDEEG